MPARKKLLLDKLDSFAAKVAARDMSLVDDLNGDGDFLMVGSERGEICRNRAELEAKITAIFASPQTISFHWPRRQVQVKGDIAWIFAEGEAVLTGPDKTTRLPYLANCIFEHVDGHWRWRQFFGSEPR